MKRQQLILLILLLILGISCKTLPVIEPYYNLVPPPSRPVLEEISDQPVKQLTENMNLLMLYGLRWEAWLENMKEYDSAH